MSMLVLEAPRPLSLRTFQISLKCLLMHREVILDRRSQRSELNGEGVDRIQLLATCPEPSLKTHLDLAGMITPRAARRTTAPTQVAMIVPTNGSSSVFTMTAIERRVKTAVEVAALAEVAVVA